MNKNRILVIAPAWLGDLVISLSFLKALKRKFVNHQIDLMVNENLYEITKYFPDISNIIPVKIKHGKLSFFYRIRLGMQLRKNHYAKCYILPNSIKSSLIPFIAKIKERIGYMGEFRYGLINRIIEPVDREEGMVNRYLNLLGLQYDESLIPRINYNIDKKVVNKTYSADKDYIVFCPDAEYGPAKRWPINKWIELANKINNQYQIIFIGLDQSIETSLKSIKTDYINLINKTSLNDILNILSNASCVIANDSGLMHLAAALDKPVVGIFGSTSPKYTPPLTDEYKKSIIYKNLSCSPCFKRECPLEHLNCLNDISSDHIRDEIFKLIK